MQKKQVIAFGELLWDCLPSGPVLGGATANCALRLHNLGVSVGLVSRLGKDELGLRARQQLKNLGLDDSFIQEDTTVPTGTVEVEISATGNPSYTIIPNVAYDYIISSPSLQAAFRQADLICYGSLIQRAPVSRATLMELLELAPQATKMVDINLRRDCFQAETVDSALRYADILKLNDSEVPQVSQLLRGVALDAEEFCDLVFMYYGIKQVLVTRAEKGVFARGKDGTVVDIPGYAVKVVDTIGSGDAFTAGFVSRYLAGDSLAACCDFGNRLGAFVATTQGGMSPITASQIEALASAPASIGLSSSC